MGAFRARLRRAARRDPPDAETDAYLCGQTSRNLLAGAASEQIVTL
jgi:hypothetical protein